MSSGEEAPRKEAVERTEREEDQEKKDISKFLFESSVHLGRDGLSRAFDNPRN